MILLLSKASRKFLTKISIAFILIIMTNPSFSQTWEALGSGVTDNIYASVEFNNALYVAGDITMAGGVAVSNIAKWDGTSWSAVGTGITGTFSYVLALAVYNGELYAGGDFSAAGGVAATDIAKWNGTAWSDVGGSPISGYINSMWVSGTNLIIGGEFLSPGNNIAQWNGSSWTTLGSGITNGGAISPNVSAVAGYNSNIYAGGNFDEAGSGNTVNRIAKWNGSAWSGLSSGINSSANAMIVYRNELYVGGNFDSAGGIFANHIAKWNGTAWSNVTSGTDVSVRAFSILNNNLFVGGSFVLAGDSAANHIARLDSNTVWHPVGSGTNGVIYAMTTYNNKICVAGSFTTAGGVAAQNIALYTMPTCLLPQAKFGLTANNNVISFTDSSTGSTAWQWNFGDSSTDTVQNPIHTYTANGTFTINLIAKNSCGSDTATQTVTITGLGIKEIKQEEKIVSIYPNPFSKNAELKIQNVVPITIGIRFTIYDLLGKEVLGQTINSKLETLNLNLPDGIYFYQLKQNDSILESGKLVIE